MKSRYRTSDQWWRENDWLPNQSIPLPIATPIFVPDEVGAQPATGGSTSDLDDTQGMFAAANVASLAGLAVHDQDDAEEYMGHEEGDQ
jgi:hypothetical protein